METKQMKQLTEMEETASKTWAINVIKNIRLGLEELQQKEIESKELTYELQGLYNDILQDEIKQLRKHIRSEIYDEIEEKSVVALMKAVCEMYEVSVDTLEVKSRKREILEPRQLFHWCMVRNLVGFKATLETIGMLTGGQDHATVLHSTKVVNDRIQFEKSFREKVMMLCNKFGFRTEWDGNKLNLYDFEDNEMED